MRKIVFMVFAVFFVLFTVRALGQYEGNEALEVPSGMELRKIGTLDVVVPEGSQVRDDNGVIYVESTNEYISRRFSDIEEQLKELRAEIKELDERLKETARQIEEINQRLEKE